MVWVAVVAPIGNSERDDGVGRRVIRAEPMLIRWPKMFASFLCYTVFFLFFLKLVL